MNHFLEAALSYASMGWHVFPCVPGGKTPITKRGLHDATTDERKIRDWWAMYPSANLAINCDASGLATVDLDVKDVDGVANWNEWCEKNGTPSNGTMTAFTPSGGRHLVYRGRVKNSTSKIAPGVDTRGVGGYIVAAPSVIGGVAYRWDAEGSDQNADLPESVAAAAGEIKTREKVAPAMPARVSAGSLADLIQADGHVLARKGALEEWCGACPWCGGHDRFVVGWDGEGRDGAGRYYCRRCDKKGDSVSWLVDRKGVGVVEAKDARGVEVPAEFRKIEARVGGTAAAAPAPVPAEGQAVAHLAEDQTSCEWLANYQRVEFPMILDNLLPAGIVGGINAEGGTGKTYLTIAMFAAIACGVTWGPFKPTRPHKVLLLLLAEDPKDIVRNRVFDIASEIIPQSYRHLLLINFRVASVRGVCGPIMGMVNGAPGPTAWMDWLDATLEAHQGVELLGLDPLRKFYGMDENKNELAHAFIGELERISLKRTLTILYNHHVAKAMRDQAVGMITGRGAGGLSDNCRWMAAMRTVDEKTAEYMELDGAPTDYVEFAVTKSNYAPMLPAPAYFQRGKHGVLSPVNAGANRKHAQAEYLCELIDGLRFSVRDLVKEAKAADIRGQMKERFSGFKKDDIHRIVEYAVSAGIMVSIPVPFGRGGRMTEILARAEND